MIEAFQKGVDFFLTTNFVFDLIRNVTDLLCQKKLGKKV